MGATGGLELAGHVGGAAGADGAGIVGASGVLRRARPASGAGGAADTCEASDTGEGGGADGADGADGACRPGGAGGAGGAVGVSGAARVGASGYLNALVVAHSVWSGLAPVTVVGKVGEADAGEYLEARWGREQQLMRACRRLVWPGTAEDVCDCCLARGTRRFTAKQFIYLSHW